MRGCIGTTGTPSLILYLIISLIEEIRGQDRNRNLPMDDNAVFCG